MTDKKVLTLVQIIRLSSISKYFEYYMITKKSYAEKCIKGLFAIMRISTLQILF